MIANWPESRPKTNKEKISPRLNHIDWDFCWCDPILETDQNGQEVMVHREVTWN